MERQSDPSFLQSILILWVDRSLGSIGPVPSVPSVVSLRSSKAPASRVHSGLRSARLPCSPLFPLAPPPVFHLEPRRTPTESPPVSLHDTKRTMNHDHQAADSTDERRTPPHHVETAVLGAGVTGLTAAAYLLSKNHHSLLVVDEKPHDQPGGTWHDHDYPNCGTDTEVATYVRCTAHARARPTRPPTTRARHRPHTHRRALLAHTRSTPPSCRGRRPSRCLASAMSSSPSGSRSPTSRWGAAASSGARASCAPPSTASVGASTATTGRWSSSRASSSRPSTPSPPSIRSCAPPLPKPLATQTPPWLILPRPPTAVP